MSYTDRQSMIQFIRYGAVGVINTMVTLLVIFVCKSLIGFNPWVSNAIGYIAGFINSFIWNKVWVFRSHNGVVREAFRFCVGFILCYGLQLLATWLLTEHTPIGDIIIDILGFSISGYGIATLMGMIIYTIANFVFNRTVTFK